MTKGRNLYTLNEIYSDESSKPESVIQSPFKIKQNSSIFTRSALSWFKILMYFAFFYAFILLISFVMLRVFLFYILNQDKPYHTGLQSILDFKPGLSLRPSLEVYRHRIHFSVKSNQSYMLYVHNIMIFLETYKEINEELRNNLFNISQNNTTKSNLGYNFLYPLESLGDCYKYDAFAYVEGKPCIFLKINRVFGWAPDITNRSLSRHILVRCIPKYTTSSNNDMTLEFSPSENGSSNMFGTFYSHLFPYIGQYYYLSPIVALQFKNVTRNTPVYVECWLDNANNILSEHLRFYLQIDD